MAWRPPRFDASYRWRVRAGDGATWSAFSADHYFVLNAVAVGGGAGPATPAGLTPGADAQPGPTVINSPVIVAWDSVAGATTYQVETEYHDGANWVALESVLVGVEEYASNPAWFADNRWRVRAGSAAGWSAWSAYKHVKPGSSGGTPAMTLAPPGDFAATGAVGGPFAPSSTSYTITNTATASSNFGTSAALSWFQVSPTQGTLAPGESRSVTITISPDAVSLPAATYSSSVTIFMFSAGSASRAVTLTVTGGGMTVTPAGAFAPAGPVGGPFSPASLVYTVANTGTAPMGWTASATQSWVTLSATGGTLAAGASTTVSVSINANANALTAGTYADTVTFTNTTNGAGNTTRPATLSVTASSAAGPMTVTPATGITSSGPPGGPFTTLSQNYVVTNAGAAPMDWTASAAQSWLSVLPTSGTLAAGASVTVIVSINGTATLLPAGAYGDTVAFTNVTNGAGSTTRAVSLTITAGGGSAAMSVTPTTGFSTSGPAGGPFPGSQTYAVTNTGTASMSFTATATQSWVNVFAGAGTLAPGASWGVIVSIDASASALAAGTYTDLVSFTNTTNGAGDTTRAVTLTVTGGSGDTTPPTCTIISPAPPSATTGSSPIPMTGTASDNVGVVSVTWTNAATGGSGAAAGTTSWSASIPLAAGSNFITLTAKDAAGNGGSASITIGFTPPAGDSVPPAVAITTPTTAPTHTATGTPLAIAGTASDNVAVGTVTWYNAATGQGGTAVGLTTWTFTAALATGVNAITVSAFDTSGNSSTDTIAVTYAPGGGGGGGSPGGSEGREGLCSAGAGMAFWAVMAAAALALAGLRRR